MPSSYHIITTLHYTTLQYTDTIPLFVVSVGSFVLSVLLFLLHLLTTAAPVLGFLGSIVPFDLLVVVLVHRPSIGR